MRDLSVIIDPRCKFSYSSWYIQGLWKFLGKDNVHFNIAPFLDLKFLDIQDLNSGMPMVIIDHDHHNRERKVFIDFEDVAKIFEDRYQWSDIYGMVNPTLEQVENYHKLVAIGPEFGIPILHPISTILLGISNYCSSRRKIFATFRMFLKDYLYTLVRRRKLSKYESSNIIRENYIFHASTLWYNQFAKTDTNKWRGEYLKACQRAGLQIEGGLFYLGESPDILEEMPDYPKYKMEYKEFIFRDRLSMDRYLAQTKASLMVFNTPAVCGCHGWKLAEYLCMGKAIISTPLLRVMPGRGLIHGENVHIVKSPEDIYDAVVRIKTDEAYRQKLERGARAYYEKWLAPEVVIKRLIECELPEKESITDSLRRT